jgi:type II secretion system protein H
VRGGPGHATSRSRRSGSRGLRSGFTLLEVLIVLMIVSIAAMIMVPPMFGAQQRLRIEAASQQLMSDLARARSEAMNRNQTVTLTRNGTSGYTIEQVGARTMDEDIAVVASSASTITFTSYGTLTPVASRTLTLALGGQTRSVVVSGGGLSRVQ